MPIIQSRDIRLKSFAQILTLGKGRNFCELGSLISDGNIKLPKSTGIFNMGSARDCPSKKLGLCAAEKFGCRCYASKAELSYHPDVLPYRRKQGKFWRSITAEDFVSQFLLINSLKRFPYKNLRLNESCDFHSQACLDKAEKIAQYLNRFKIKTYCYSSREDLNFSEVKNLIVSGSNFTKKGISNIFKIIGKKEEKIKGWRICKGDCRVCNYCQVRGNMVCVRAH